MEVYWWPSSAQVMHQLSPRTPERVSVSGSKTTAVGTLVFIGSEISSGAGAGAEPADHGEGGGGGDGDQPEQHPGMFVDQRSGGQRADHEADTPGHAAEPDDAPVDGRGDDLAGDGGGE